MKQVTYHNRYGDNIIFKEADPTTVIMYGFEYYRMGDDFIDPSGGPYIQIGTDIGRYFDDGKERRVKSIKVIEGKAIFTI
jgi:hypothetical protein